MSAEVIAALVAVGSFIAAVIGAFVKGQAMGRQSAEREHLQERVHGAGERANADRDAGRAADPAAELRRDWRRGL